MGIKGEGPNVTGYCTQVFPRSAHDPGGNHHPGQNREIQAGGQIKAGDQ